jgi:SAM-dependent methyltransferase
MIIQEMTHWKADDLEKVPCDFCGKDNSKDVIVRPDGLKVVECSGCGLSYLSPRPKKELISKFYEADYFTKPNHSGPSSSIGYPDYFSEKNRSMLNRIAGEKYQIMCRYVNPQNMRCLEIGCAAGEFSSLLSQRGAQVVGIDLSARAIQEAKSRYPQVNFFQADITTLSEQPFDVILAFEVIEHVISPTEFLKAVFTRLRPGGFAVLTTPNYACGKSLGAKRWSGFSTSFEHLYFFTPDALTACASAAGLATVDWLTDYDDGIARTPGEASTGSSTASTFKTLLRRLHLLNAARMVKNKVAPAPPAYRSHGQGHNLFMVMKRGAR